MKLTNYLIPNETNDYKPWITTTQALGVFVLIIWTIRLLLPSEVTLAAGGIDASDLMSKINFERTSRFIPSLVANSKLTTAASGKAQDMLRRSYFAHVDPDGNYVWPRIESAGFKPYSTLGENLAMDFTSAEAMVSAWMNSPTHRANIVNEKFEDQGLASVSGTFEPGHDTIIAVSLFGTLYKTQTSTPVASTKTPAPKPEAKPRAKPAPVAQAPKKETPKPQPETKPVTPTSTLIISKDIKLEAISLSGQTKVNVDVVIAGKPTLVTARLKSQSITLLAGKTSGQFLGAFTFDSGEDLAKQTLTIEARDTNSVKIASDFTVNIQSPGVSGAEKANLPIPVSNEAQVIKILRIVFGAFSLIYMVFLAIDAFIIHRSKLKNAGVHTNTHALLFLLITGASLFLKF